MLLKGTSIGVRISDTTYKFTAKITVLSKEEGVDILLSLKVIDFSLFKPIDVTGEVNLFDGVEMVARRYS